MSKIKQKISNFMTDMKAWSHKKVIAPIFSSLKSFVSYLKNAPILPVIAGGLIVAFLVTGLMLNGSVQKFSSKLVQNVTAVTHKSLEKSGFGLRDVTVEGRFNTRRAELRRVVKARIGESIFKIDLDATRVRVENLPWVKSATVTRILPDLLHIQIEERKAFALWRHNKSTSLIDRTGAIIQTRSLDKYQTLPYVRGKKSEHTAAQLFDLLSDYPVVRNRMIGAERISDRRWTIYLDHGGSIHLPAEKVKNALNLLMDMERDKKVLAMKGRVIDLRLPDRVVLRARPLPVTSLFRKRNNT